MNDRTNKLSDEQLMLLMAYADGELDGDELAAVEGLIRENDTAREWAAGFAAAKEVTHAQITEPATGPDLSDVTEKTAEQTVALQVMAYADGELTSEQQRSAQIDALLDSSEHARNWLHDLKVAKQALHDEVMRPNTTADLSMVRGRVMRKLPLETGERTPVDERPGLVAAVFNWLAELGFGKTVLTASAVAAVLLLAIGIGKVGPKPVVHKGDGPVMSKVVNLAPPAHSQPVDGEPEVIIEEMESDGGTVIFEGGEKPGEAVIIWHIGATEEGAG